jgi:hypothetical protein
MERSLEASQWRRSFAAGTIALGLSLGGHFATTQAEVTSCPLEAQRASLARRISPEIGAPQIAQRVAKAVLGLVLRKAFG